VNAITWTPVSCAVANTIVGAPDIVISRGRTDVSEGAFREYSTGTGTPVLREWITFPVGEGPCRHEVPAPEVVTP
jgi:hypothetical protein